MALSYGFVGQVITRWTVEMRYLAWAPTNGPYMWIRYTLITQGQICHLSNANHGRDLNIELFKNPPSLFPMKEAKQDRNSEIEFGFFRVSINPRFHLYVPISQCFRLSGSDRLWSRPGAMGRVMANLKDLMEEFKVRTVYWAICIFVISYFLSRELLCL